MLSADPRGGDCTAKARKAPEIRAQGARAMALTRWICVLIELPRNESRCAGMGVNVYYTNVHIWSYQSSLFGGPGRNFFAAPRAQAGEYEEARKLGKTRRVERSSLWPKSG